MESDELSEEALRAMLKPRRYPPQSRTKGRQWVMTSLDIRAFVRILRERFPSILFAAPDRRDPDLPWNLLCQPWQSTREVYGVVPDDSWRGEKHEFRLSNGSIVIGPYFRFERSGLAYFPEAPKTQSDGNLRDSYLQGGYMPSDRETARFLARVWRASEKITTNKVKEIDCETGRTIWPCITGGPWCGFDALRWCQQSDKRVLEGNCRPTDDWVMPDSPYYDD